MRAISPRSADRRQCTRPRPLTQGPGDNNVFTNRDDALL